MRQKTDRVVAIDYFKGLFIMSIILNHAFVFSTPYAYLTGADKLWTSAAGMFFLLSGITFSVVRGPAIRTGFKKVVLKSWRRAGIIYLLLVATSLASLVLANVLGFIHLGGSFPEPVPQGHGLFYLLGQTLRLHLAFGWASFLIYFPVFIGMAPFLAYIMRGSYWLVVPFVSFGLFALAAFGVLPTAGYLWNYNWFFIWQVYFVIGMILGLRRVEILSWYNRLEPKKARRIAWAIPLSGLVVLALSYLIELNNFFAVQADRWAAKGWLPHWLNNFYHLLLAHKDGIDSVLMKGRAGFLRPAVALLLLGSLYIIYQARKESILKRTGHVVLSFGQNTLGVFIAQAAFIPLLSILPVPRNPLTNLALTALLFYLMWQVASGAYTFAGFKRSIRYLIFGKKATTYRVPGYVRDI